MGLIEELWFGNVRPNLYEPDEAEKRLLEQLEELTNRIHEKYPDEPDIDELIDVSSKLMVQQSGRAFNEGVRFGFDFANAIRK